MGATDAYSREYDERLMRRALELARLGAGSAAPNPMVGCVLAGRDGAILAESWHERPGGAHAEVAALAAAGPAARGATAYVTLEPCNHTGRTGPCAQALTEAGIGAVVFAMRDPNPIAQGGAARLRAAGVEVRDGVCEAEARALNRAWLHGLEHRRPLVALKLAMSLDGRIAARSGESQWITSPESRAAGHALRAQSDAIITGAGTVIADDPALTARENGETRYPFRVILDSGARTPPGAKVYERTGRGALLAATKDAPESRVRKFAEMGVETIASRVDAHGRVDLDAVLDALFERGVRRAMVEAGGVLAGSFFDADLVDEIDVFVAPKLLGGGAAALAGDGVDRLADASRFDIEQIDHPGPDFRFHAVRRRERS